MEDRHFGAYAIDGDHVALLRAGRHSGETWVTGLGDDPVRVVALIDRLRDEGFDGVTVHDHVFAELPDDLRGPDPGHWALWQLDHLALAEGGLAGSIALEADDPRIDPLLEHSESAYIHAGNPVVAEWRGIVEDGRLAAVGARVRGPGAGAHLVSICVDPRSRGRGLGRLVTSSLTESALREGAEPIWLEMYAENAAAARVYRAVGFAEQGRYRSALIPGA
jgi:ribosomal protein S18 acetylase RimI-like enzyme